ncbi:uncharacterized protein VP01_9262g1, partial [Puccinia sorghi]
MPVSYCSNIPTKFTYLCPCHELRTCHMTQPQPLSLSLEQPCHPVRPTPGSFVKQTTPPHLAPVLVNPPTQWTRSMPSLTKETLQKTQARLDATDDKKTPLPLPLPPPIPWFLQNPKPSMGPMVPLPRRFKVVFAILFMKDYAETWSQLYLDKVFNGEPGFFSYFLDDFGSSFFDHNCQHHAKVALQNLQTGTV